MSDEVNVDQAEAGDRDIEARLDVDARKAEAEAQRAEVAAAQAAAEAREWSSLGAKQARDADRAKSVAEARGAAIDSQQKVIDSLVPNLAGASRGSTTTSGTTLFTTLLTERGVRRAAKALVADVYDELVSGAPLLLITEEDLASSDAAHLSVVTGFLRALSQIDRVIGGEATGEGNLASVAPVGGAAVAAALPPVLSLLSADRSLSGGDASIDSALTVATVARELHNHGIEVILDRFRLLDGDAEILAQEKLVLERRDALNDRRILESIKRDEADRRCTDAQAMIDELTRTLASKDLEMERKPGLQEELAGAMRNRDTHLKESLTSAALVEHAIGLLERVDAFLAAIRTTSDGSSQSPLVAALLRELVHPTAPRPDPAVPMVMFVRATSGSVSQLVEDRPFLFKDRFEAIAGVTIAYWLVSVASGQLVLSGAHTGTARITGTVGKSFTISDID